MAPIQTPSKGRAAVVAALSFGLAFSGLTFSTMLSAPSEALAEEDGGTRYSDLAQSLTVEVKGVSDEVLDSDSFGEAVTITLESTAGGEEHKLVYDKDNKIFRAFDIPAGQYRVHIELNSDDYRVTIVNDGGDRQSITNGSEILLDNNGDGMSWARLTLVTRDAGTYTPTAKSLVTTVRTILYPEDAISNKNALPEYTAYSWETRPDTSAPGETTGTVTVHYPDGSSENVEVPVTVKLGLQKATIIVHDARGAEYPVAEAIKNLKVNIKDAGDTNHVLTKDADSSDFKAADLEAGNYTLSVEGLDANWRLVASGENTYLSGELKQQQTFNGNTLALENAEDGTNTFYLIITPTQSSTNEPTAKSLETTVGNTPNAEDGISNKDSMPTGTTYTWESAPDTSAPGETTGTVTVHYPDGSSENVEVAVTVTATPDPEPEPNPEPETPSTPDTPETPETPDNKTPDNPATPNGTEANKAATQPALQAKLAAPSDVKPVVKPQAQATPQTGDPAGILGTVASFFGAGALGVAAALRRRR